MIHGGDIYRNAVRLDFSVNVNPLGVPASVRQALHDAVDTCNVYPDIRAEALQTAVSGMLKLPKTCLLFGNGASELFVAVVHAIKPSKVVIPVPSFYGYEHAAKTVTKQLCYYSMQEKNGFLPQEDLFELLDKNTDMLFLANPNNPTGARLKLDYLLRLLTHCRDNQIFVVLDECFIEFCEGENSMVDRLAEFPNVILIRAFTKSFAIPGVRLGYLICRNLELLQNIQKQLPEWNLSVFAQAAGVACVKEQEFLKKTAAYIKKEREILMSELEKLCGRNGFSCWLYPSAANFLLLYSDCPLYERLLEQGILIRNCASFKGLGAGYYRIAVRSREENEQLWKAIGEINWNESNR